MRAARAWLLPRDAPSCLLNATNSKFADNSRRLRRQLQVAPQRPRTSGPSRVASRCSLKQPWTTTSRMRRWMRTSSTTAPMVRRARHRWQAMAATAAPVLLTRPAVEAPRAVAAEVAAEAAAGAAAGAARRQGARQGAARAMQKRLPRSPPSIRGSTPAGGGGSSARASSGRLEAGRGRARHEEVKLLLGAPPDLRITQPPLKSPSRDSRFLLGL